MRRSARRLGLHNVEIIRADAQTQSYDDLAYLFVNSPFFPDAARQFIAKLKSSRRRTLTVIAVNNIAALYRDDGDFTEIDHGVDICGLSLWDIPIGPLGPSRTLHQPALLHRRPR